MKNKQNLLNQENNKLKEIINNQEGSFDNFGQNEIKMNNIQNLNLYKKINGENNESKLNFETPIGTNRSTKNNKNNFINIDENIEQTFGNNNINNNNSGNNMNYKNNFTYDINSSSYIDTKEARQKRTLNNFKQLLDKMDEKIEIQ